MDLDRDAASSFGPDTLRAGAILPYEGRALVRAPEGLRSAALAAANDGWLADNNPVLVRGDARILPLAWRGDPASEDSEMLPKQIDAFASQMKDAGAFWAGGWRTFEQLAEHCGDSIGSYVAALRAAGVTDVSAWTFSEEIGLALVRCGVESEGTMSLALHIVPAAWVSERFVAKKPVKGIDVRWSWADVIDLYRAR